MNRDIPIPPEVHDQRVYESGESEPWPEADNPIDQAVMDGILPEEWADELRDQAERIKAAGDILDDVHMRRRPGQVEITMHVEQWDELSRLLGR